MKLDNLKMSLFTLLQMHSESKLFLFYEISNKNVFCKLHANIRMITSTMDSTIECQSIWTKLKEVNNSQIVLKKMIIILSEFNSY